MDFLNQDTDFAEMIHHFDELMQGPVTQESVDEMNAMIPMINEFITAYTCYGGLLPNTRTKRIVDLQGKDGGST